MTDPVTTPSGIDHSTEALEKLLDISKRLGASSDLPVVLGVIIDALRDLLNAERATVLTYEPKSNELAMHVAHGVSGDSGASVVRFSATTGIAGACATTRTMINIPDAYADARFNREIDLRTGFCTKSILAIPLIDDAGELVGVAQVLNTGHGEFTRLDEQIASGIAAHAAIALRRARLIQDQIEKLRLQEEMSVAREMQQASFPSALPVHTHYDLAAFSTPAEACGGDAFDCFPLRANTIARAGETPDYLVFLIADATGHGVGPALSSIQVRGMLRVAARLGQPLGAIAREINAQAVQDLPAGHFVTAWMGILDLATHSIECFSAGQGPIFVYRRAEDRFEEIESDAPPLGIMVDGFDQEGTRRIELNVGDIVMLITDGYYEAVDPKLNMWGEPGVQAVVRRMRDEPLDAVRRELDRAVLGFAQADSTIDDRTAILLKRLS